MPNVHPFEPEPGAMPELIQFRRVLSSLLSELEACWTLGTPFRASTMFQLAQHGRALVRQGICPEFRWLDEPFA